MEQRSLTGNRIWRKWRSCLSRLSFARTLKPNWKLGFDLEHLPPKRLAVSQEPRCNAASSSSLHSLKFGNFLMELFFFSKI